MIHQLDVDVDVVKGFLEIEIPVHLNFFKQPFYTSWQTAKMKNLSESVAAALKV